MSRSTRQNWKAYPRMIFAENMKQDREVMLVYPAVQIGKISRIWLQRRWQKRNKKWREMPRRAKSSSFEGLVAVHLYLAIITCNILTY